MADTSSSSISDSMSSRLLVLSWAKGLLPNSVSPGDGWGSSTNSCAPFVNPSSASNHSLKVSERLVAVDDRMDRLVTVKGLNEVSVL